MGDASLEPGGTQNFEVMCADGPRFALHRAPSLVQPIFLAPAPPNSAVLQLFCIVVAVKDSLHERHEEEKKAWEQEKSQLLLKLETTEGLLSVERCVAHVIPWRTACRILVFPFAKEHNGLW